jgi:hypothetical protein
MVEFLKRDGGDTKTDNVWADSIFPHLLSSEETKMAIAQLLHDTVPPCLTFTQRVEKDKDSLAVGLD